MTPDSRYAVMDGTKFREEAFGGIVYQRNGDCLHFLHSQLALQLLYRAGSGTVREIAASLGVDSGKGEVTGAVLKALCRLEELGIVYDLGPGDKVTECPRMPDLAADGQV